MTWKLCEILSSIFARVTSSAYLYFYNKLWIFLSSTHFLFTAFHAFIFLTFTLRLTNVSHPALEHPRSLVYSTVSFNFTDYIAPHCVMANSTGHKPFLRVTPVHIYTQLTWSPCKMALIASPSTVNAGDT